MVIDILPDPMSNVDTILFPVCTLVRHSQQLYIQNGPMERCSIIVSLFSTNEYSRIRKKNCPLWILVYGTELTHLSHQNRHISSFSSYRGAPPRAPPIRSINQEGEWASREGQRTKSSHLSLPNTPLATREEFYIGTKGSTLQHV